MKTDSYKNKKPIFLKFLQITALLIGSAFFTVQAKENRPPPELFDYPPAQTSIHFLQPWSQATNNSLTCFRPADLLLYSEEYAGHNDNPVPFEITINFDNRILSDPYGSDNNGSATVNGYYPSPDGIAVALLDIEASPPLGYNPFVVNTTLIRLSGTLNGAPIMPNTVEVELPNYWSPICQTGA